MAGSWGAVVVDGDQRPPDLHEAVAVHHHGRIGFGVQYDAGVGEQVAALLQPPGVHELGV